MKIRYVKAQGYNLWTIGLVDYRYMSSRDELFQFGSVFIALSVRACGVMDYLLWSNTMTEHVLMKKGEVTN